MRVYELAKKFAVTSKEILTALHDEGYEASSHMANLSEKACDFVEKRFGKKAPQEKIAVAPKTQASVQSAPVVKKIVQEKEAPGKPVVHNKPVEAPKHISQESQKTRPTQSMPQQPLHKFPDAQADAHASMPLPRYPEKVLDEDFEAREIAEQERIKKLLQSTGFSGAGLAQQQAPRRRRRRRFRHAAQQQEEAPKVVTEVNLSQGMLLHEVADLFGKQSGELILFLLKKGMPCNRNHMLSLDTIKQLGTHFNIAVHAKVAPAQEAKAAATSKGAGIARWPVVVVMGHVDHGKTTLLDYIRKMNVAASEKGGITQHIRAWEVDSAHGKIVFLDTPGHEAFSYLRARGSKITDLVVLVVAVDDGIKPQTVEAIKHAKEAGVPIIVAVNKIDKMSSPAALETVKRQLVQYELMPEDWGGQTVLVPLSAKTGQGVNELLEMIVLQAEMAELTADPAANAQAFVLESHVEKGFGPVATVICKEGTLKQGDYFVCGSTTGKVRILVNSHGKRVTQAAPSTPVQVVGFDSFAGVGEVLTVVTQQEYGMARAGRGPEALGPSQFVATMTSQQGEASAKGINIILKTDTRGAKEAIVGSIEKLSKTHKDIKCPVNIITSGIGDISEGDIELAESTKSMILGFNVKVEKNAQLIAKDKAVDIQTHQIIYQLIDYIEKLIISKKEAVYAWNKVGEATVKKVFDIKGIGIIAGCYLRDGVLSRGNKVVCMRNNRQIGEGKITSLQRDRKPVKEIHAGYECGFTVDGFNEWVEGDTVLCYAETRVG